MKSTVAGVGAQGHEGDKKCLNSELWHACAGPLVSLPNAGSRVVYFPQGHSEQVAATTTNKEIDGHIPNYPSLQPQLICQLHNISMHADAEADEVYAQMTLQPLRPEEQNSTFASMELGSPSKQPINYFCKTLTASDTSTHGGFSVPRRAAEKVFPPLDFSLQPPAQELTARDLHDVEWKFRHIFRGQPKRHLLTTGWSVFVTAKRLVTGDSIIFIQSESNQLFLGIRRANRSQVLMPSSVISSDSMHIGLLAAAAHAAATNTCFTVFYHPRASSSEFVIPLSKYIKAAFHTRISIGTRFRMLFETEESSVRRYMGTVTSISDLDPVRWPNSHWRSVKVGWDESTASQTQQRVSLWEIEPLTTSLMYPSLFPLRLKRPWYPGQSSMTDSRRELPNSSSWLRVGTGEQDLSPLNLQSLGLFPQMQQQAGLPLLGTDRNQQYHALLTTGNQDIENGNHFTQQFGQLDEPHQYRHNSEFLQQQSQELLSDHLLQAETQILTGVPYHPMRQQLHNQSDEQAHKQDQDYYNNALEIQNGELQEWRQPDVPSASFTKTNFNDLNNMKTEFNDTSNKFSSSATPIQNMFASMCPVDTGNLLNFSTTGQAVRNGKLPQESWAPTHTQSHSDSFAESLSLPSVYSGKDAMVESGNFNRNAQSSSRFGLNIDSTGLLLPSTALGFSTSSIFQSPFYSCTENSSELYDNKNADPLNPSKTFVKVCKTGSVGRSLDISRFSSYYELREELVRMFGSDGNSEDPFRSGWQLVFVDKENDVLLLGDDPWDSFVSNVGYIKILSPEDMQNMGEPGVGSSVRP